MSRLILRITVKLKGEFARNTHHPDHHYSYSRFCRLYREWLAGLKATMRQTHRAGEKMFVDYAGPTVSIVNASTGEVL